MNGEYWNEGYWSRHLGQTEKMDLFEQLWITAHQDLIDSLPKGRVLDLGCGIGQNTAYFRQNGFEVISADLSQRALEELLRYIPDASVTCLDMRRPLPFEDQSFDVVFASLSIHYFDSETTCRLSGEIRRILKHGGYFIGSVNSSRAFRYIEDHARELEENFYFEGGRTVRLFDRAQFGRFFGNFEEILLCETRAVRFGSSKEMWEFVYRKS